MKALNRAIDRFCLKHRRFGIRRLMMYIVFCSAAVYLISMMDTTYTFISLLSFSPEAILRGEIWRLVTWIVCAIGPAGQTMPIGSILMTALMLYFYYFIGSTLEREWGTPKFTVFYIFGVVLNIIYGFAIWLIFGLSFPIGVFYLNLSMFLAFAVMFPDHVVLVFFIIPVKIKWLALIDAGVFLLSMIQSLIARNYVMAVFPVVAILNFLLFCGPDLLELLRPIRARGSKQTIDFKKAAKRARRENEGKNYRHKCAVCGRTDADSPGTEFRYCSRCNGYHCFCIDHINNHVHFN